MISAQESATRTPIMVTSKARNVDEYLAQCDAPLRYDVVRAFRRSERRREARVEEEVTS